ncbi:MAG: hypothetical protein A2664_01340 [Candidatus Taylorbacteria bacterium RIFCSPHIGHO2_01_FULL_46_22b]|uniref:DNA polymerase III delta N-terminal domain-containing protein n=1 Tax=Candidatus Taylorbacteria bacterium RIFCSPHIGHO2_01_FULL_46_22b TaxID=1802301 RepID=A0A1G2M260_9BACT|nr:MAG: hypothetical protein A2664_01340 [Candidatus Taylorbacteria bacterium RIFCSPHIGHO2_01_FULL_46_22b]
MLYFFYGTDIDKSRARARGVIGAMRKKRPDAEYFRMTADKWDSVSFEQLIGGQGLFDQKSVVFVDGVFENKEGKEWIISHAKEIGCSENGFVFLERTCDSVSLKKIEKHSKEVIKFDLLSVGNKWGNTEGNVFALADALGKRDRKGLWTLLVEQFDRGASAEEINGMLFWQVKSMLSASFTDSAADAGLKPFVYTKSKQFSRNYSTDELVNLSRKLLCAYHDAHRGINDFPVALERLALSI